VDPIDELLPVLVPDVALVPDPVVPLVPDPVAPAPLAVDEPLPPRAEPIIALVSMKEPPLVPALADVPDAVELDDEPLPLCRQPVTVIVSDEPLREDELV
jgi:hypothetical protein